jgi:uncharacterized protein (TIGR02099 family)
VNKLQFWLRFILKRLGYLAILCIVLLAVLIGIARAMTPVLNQYRQDIVYFISQRLGVPVQINAVSATWHWLQPMLQLHEVDILQPNTNKTLLHVNELDVGIDLFKSLWHRSFQPGTIIITGTSLQIVQTAQGSWGLTGIPRQDNVPRSAPANAHNFIGWLLSRDRVSLHQVNIQVLPQQHPQFQLNKITLDLLNIGKRHYIDFNAIFIGHATIPIEASARLEGDANHPESMLSQVHIFLQDINLPAWLPQWHDFKVQGNLAVLDVAANFSGKHMMSTAAQFGLDHVLIRQISSKKTYNIDFLAGNAKLQRALQQAWQLQLTHLLFSRNGINWPDNNAQIWWKQQNDTLTTGGKIGFIRLQELLPILQFSHMGPDKLQQALSSMQPMGELDNIQWQTQQTANQPINFNIKSQLNNLQWHAWQSIPGITHLTGALQLQPQQGSIQVNSTNLVATFLTLFRQPLPINVLKANIGWQHQQNVWQIKSKQLQLANTSATVNGNLNLTFPDDNSSPVIDLTAQTAIAQLSKADIYHYLPVGILSDTVVSWLDSNILALGKTDASLTLRGPVTDFPFDETHNGEFLIKAPFQQTTMQLSPGWPTATDLQGTMVFAGSSMDIQVTGGNLTGMQITQARAQIPYMGNDKPVILSINATANADAAAALTFLHKSPLSSYLQAGLETAQLQGPIQTTVNLSIPLAQADTVEPVVDGIVNLQKVDATFPVWQIQLTDMQGPLHFDTQGLSSAGINGQFLDAPLQMTMQAPAASNNNQTLINLQGGFDMAKLAKQYQLPIAGLAQGQANFTSKIAISSDQSLTVNITSPLTGVQLNLPKPLKKVAADTVPLSVTWAALAKQAPQLSFSYGSQAAGIFQFSSPTNLTFNSGSVMIGSNQVNAPTAPGLTVAGNLALCSLPVAQQLLKQVASVYPTATKKTGGNWPTWLNSIDFNCQQLALRSQTFTNADVSLSHQPDSYTVGINATEAQGSVVLPNNWQQTPITAQFARLYLSANTNTSASSMTINPSKLPVIQATINDLRYANYKFGQVKINLQPNLPTVNLTLDISQGKAMSGQVQVGWNTANSTTQTTGKLQSSDTSQALRNLNLPSNLKSHQASMNFALNWSGAPYQFAWANLNGWMNLNLTDGVIDNLDKSTSAKVGLGRIITLLSVQNIPSRLHSFSDSPTNNGFNFNSIVGKFVLQQGVATINQAALRGSVADIQATGQIGLADQSYNMNMTITPHVTSSIPVVATLAGGPIAGAVAWAADKVLSPAVNKMTQYQYRVTGTWSKPIITKL